MKEWNILFAYPEDGNEYFVVLPSFWKVLLWFVTTAWKCSDIKIFLA